MLVLTRKPGDFCELKDTRTGEILGTVHICAVRGVQVSVGFQFEPHISIIRDNARKHDYHD